MDRAHELQNAECKLKNIRYFILPVNIFSHFWIFELRGLRSAEKANFLKNLYGPIFSTSTDFFSYFSK